MKVPVQSHKLYGKIPILSLSVVVSSIIDGIKVLSKEFQKAFLVNRNRVYAGRCSTSAMDTSS